MMCAVDFKLKRSPGVNARQHVKMIAVLLLKTGTPSKPPLPPSEAALIFRINAL